MAAGLALLSCAACSLPGPISEDGAPLRPSGGRSSFAGMGDEATGAAREQVHSELIQSMLAQKQYYAALAHIQQAIRQDGETSELRYLEAEARRELGQATQAEALYKELLDDRQYAAAAHHGLGLLHATQGRLKLAVQHLRQAAGRQPTDAGIRNDLGYALIQAGQYAEALPELATAVELAPGDPRGSNNLVLLLILQGDEAGVRRMVQESGISKDQLARLRKQAQSLKNRRNR